MSITKVVEGSYAIAMAVKQCRPKVISAYPITPQTHIVEYLAKMVSDMELDAKYVWADSEFAAASIVLGASAVGNRSYTASSSQGLLLMTEVLWNMAGMRLPVVITAANRALSAPITIEVDHQDTMSFRDCGIVQVYVEEPQEAYETHFVVYKVAENDKVLLPAVVCVDGWTLTHAYEPVTFCDQEIVDDFLPEYEPLFRLTPDNPIVLGSWADESVIMESRYEMFEAQKRAEELFERYSSDLAEITGNDFGGVLEEYHTKDAKICFVAMGSICGTIKRGVDKLRENGKRAGLIRIRLYRPFPENKLREIVEKYEIEKLVVIDRSYSIGSGSCLSLDLKSSLYGMNHHPAVVACFAGIGGKMVSASDVEDLFNYAKNLKEKSKTYWLNLYK